MSHNAWLEHFKDQFHGLEEFHQASGSTLSLLGYALMEKRLKPDEYFPWAMRNYGLPLLHSHFYTETPPSIELFSRWNNHYPWSAECIPVAEWENSLIVACLAPPQDFPNMPPCIFVLSSPNSLSECWQRFTQTAAAAIAAPATKPAIPVAAPIIEAAVPEGIDMTLATKITSQPDSSNFSADDIQLDAVKSTVAAPDENILEDHNSDVIEVATEPEEEQLEGILSEGTVTTLQSLGTATVVHHSEAAPAAPAEKTEAPPVVSEKVVSEKTVVDGRTLPMLEPLASTPPSAVVTLQVVPPPAETPATVPATAAAPSIPSLPKTPVESESATVIAKLPPAPREDSFVDTPIPVASTEPKVITPSQVVLSSINSGGVFILERWKKKNLTVVTDSIGKILTQMKNHFDKSLILSLDDKETQLLPFAWDETLKEAKETTHRIPLKVDSIFNVVATTQKPYHGYISINEVNEKFFEDWNQGRVPDHVTITPIIIQTKLVGVLMGIGEKTAYSKAVLATTEKMSNELAAKLDSIKAA